VYSQTCTGTHLHAQLNYCIEKRIKKKGEERKNKENRRKREREKEREMRREEKDKGNKKLRKTFCHIKKI
jgi:hypothetical protein